MEEYKDISRGLKMLLGKAEEMGWNWEAYIEPDNRRTKHYIHKEEPEPVHHYIVIAVDSAV